MNDRRFIELLNLYVDQQIEPAEAAELEAEVMRNPARRETYNQYCRLQRGCSLLGNGARALAPSSTGFERSLREAERKISAPRRSDWRATYVGIFSATAMAACVALVLLMNQPASGPDMNGGGVAQSESNRPAVAATLNSGLPLTTVASSDTRSFDVQPVLTANAIGVARNVREVEIIAGDREVHEWMQRVELMPVARVVVDEQAFEARPTLQQDNRVFRSRHSIQGSTGFTAFQFQR